MAVKRLSAVVVGEEFRFVYWLDTTRTVREGKQLKPDPEFVRTYTYARYHGGVRGAPKTPASPKSAAREAELAATADAARLTHSEVDIEGELV